MFAVSDPAGYTGLAQHLWRTDPNETVVSCCDKSYPFITCASLLPCVLCRPTATEDARMVEADLAYFTTMHNMRSWQTQAPAQPLQDVLYGLGLTAAVAPKIRCALIPESESDVGVTGPSMQVRVLVQSSSAHDAILLF